MGRRGRRRPPAGSVRGLGLLLALVLVTAVAGCTRLVAGTPAVAPPHAFPVTAGAAAPGTVAPGAPPPAGSGSPPARGSPADGSAAAVAPAALEPAALPDECLLDAARLTALLGRPVGAPRQSVVRRDDGSRGSGCYAAALPDPRAPGAGPAAAVDVYRVRTGTPAAFVRAAAAGGRALTGAGEAAAVLDTAGGSTLQVAGTRFVVSVAVQGAEPDDAAWRAAGRAALARLSAVVGAR